MLHLDDASESWQFQMRSAVLTHRTDPTWLLFRAPPDKLWWLLVWFWTCTALGGHSTKEKSSYLC